MNPQQQLRNSMLKVYLDNILKPKKKELIELDNTITDSEKARQIAGNVKLKITPKQDTRSWGEGSLDSNQDSKYISKLAIEDIKKTGSDIILSNTYHLMIRPGVERIQSAGGLHSFMNCDLPILTDSGGFQVMSLSKLNKIDREKGAIFNSHVDGKKFFLSPEESIRIQLGLNSDIVMIMDECPKNTNDYKLIKKSIQKGFDLDHRPNFK